MYPINEFIERNQSTYIKVADVPKEIIVKYKNILPKELICIWETMGFGIYENGFLQLINPDEWSFVFEYIDKMLEPTIPWGITALGDILFWEGNDNWTIAPDEGDRCFRVDVRKCDSIVIDNMEGILNVFINTKDNYFIAHKDYFDAKPYLEIKDTLPKLEYGQCYGYVPALAMGGKKSNKNLKIVDAKTYVDMIGQAVGKIYDLS
ncbi:glutamyl-tRNA amidotransferase [Porphyromonadaceae bacterium COT-184 OH4590]|nr:glutamyl-tRNA amidotransferase [Porphyromonadaceae bacterium COT-184 OH4590]